MCFGQILEGKVERGKKLAVVNVREVLIPGMLMDYYHDHRALGQMSKDLLLEITVPVSRLRTHKPVTVTSMQPVTGIEHNNDGDGDSPAASNMKPIDEQDIAG